MRHTDGAVNTFAIIVFNLFAEVSSIVLGGDLDDTPITYKYLVRIIRVGIAEASLF